jgi:hypothetical protein
MIVELNGEAVDGIIKSILIQDYKNLCSDINNLESARELPKYKQEDLVANREYKAAMEKLMEYYIGFDWQTELKG